MAEEKQEKIKIQRFDEQIMEIQIARGGIECDYMQDINNAELFLIVQQYFEEEELKRLVGESRLINARKFVELCRNAKIYLEGVDKKIIKAEDCRNEKFIKFKANCMQLSKYVYDFKRALIILIAETSMDNYSISNEARYFAKENYYHLDLDRSDRDRIKEMQKRENESFEVD